MFILSYYFWGNINNDGQERAGDVTGYVGCYLRVLANVEVLMRDK